MHLPFNVDPGRALFAVALAVLLYFVALSETNPADERQTPYTVPVQVVNAPSSLVLTTPPPGIKLWVRSTQNVFNRLGPASFSVQVDASGAHAGDNDSLPITATSTDPEASVTPDQANVRLQFEEIREQALPVRVNVTGQVQTGYQVGQATVDPSQLKIAGAASLVGRATEAVVDVSVDRVTVSVNGVYTARIVDDRGNELKDAGLRVTPPSVTVQVPIVQQTQYKQVGVKPDTSGQPAVGYAVQPLEVNPPTATLVGDGAALDGASYIPTAPVDITNISSTIVRSVALVPPPGTLLLQQGQTVTVTVRVTTLQMTQTVRVPPTIINLSGAVQLARALDFVSVTISGPAPVLSTLVLNPKDFKVLLDASGKGPGIYDIDVKVQQVPAGLNLEDFQPKKVQVELRDAPPAPTPTAVPVPTPSLSPASPASGG